MRKATRIGGIALSLFAFASCGQSEKKHEPFVTIEGGQVKTLTQEQAESFCHENSCEPNQLYFEEMGCAPSQGSQQQGTVADSAPAGFEGETPNVQQPKQLMSYAHKIMNTAEGWELTPGSRDIVVAVIDGGMQYNHPDLKENVWFNVAEKNGTKGVDDDSNGYVDDIYGYDFHDNKGNGWDPGGSGHGTHVAGIIGAANNSIGVVGVSPRVRIMPLRFMGKDGSGSLADAVAAVRYATKNGARVISMSWGGGYSKILADAVAAARSAGIIVVASSGNDGQNHDKTGHYPSGFDGVIAVGSSATGDKKSSFSNYGSRTVDIMAPGSEIRSTYLGGKYAKKSGTSMAAPQVSGAIALALSLRPSLGEGEIRQDLCDSAAKVLTNYSQCGRLDVGSLIRRVSQR